MATATANKLKAVSWDFLDAKTGEGSHGIHPYPAKFIPQIPRNLVHLLHPGDQSYVLDPFCGSGTTLVESMLSGLPSIGIDLHPLATLLAKVKTTPLIGNLVLAGQDALLSAKKSALGGKVSIPQIPRVDHWFRRDVQVALAALVSAIHEIKDQDVADALRIALSSVIVRVSNQESDTRYAAIDKDVSQDSVWAAFRRATIAVGSALESLRPGLFQEHPKPRIITKDLMSVEPNEIGKGVGLVVTSPPYPNAYEYWLYHKYRMYWLGMDPIAVREREIGARPHYFKKNHQTEVDFERQMNRCFWLLSQVMNRGAFACFVIGRSIIHGRKIDNEALLERSAVPYGFVKVASPERTIAINRKSFNLSHATIKTERIVVFVLES